MSAVVVSGRTLREGSGPTVVLLHPLGAGADFWTAAAAELDGFGVYAVDLPGHGGCPVPEDPYDTADVATALATHLRGLGHENVHVVGLSLGGLIALELAVHDPGLVASLVVAAAVPTYPQDWREKWRARAAEVVGSGMAPFVEPTLQLWLTPEALAADGPEVSYVRRALAGTDPRGYALACLALATADVTPRLGEITAPTLLIDGQLDAPLFHDGAARLAEAITGSRRAVVAGARHASALEFAEPFARLVGDWARVGHVEGSRS
ncbi:alpha/beta fold hydrolase [Micromonospora sp. DT68]|uniref:alpha/beta fold hydrolase n=1 Tax=Micromonospora TaxID=1873 RepID=UPI0006AEB760|nr:MULTISPECIES: alpha/beta fold hydrolase [Micromonospora]NJC10745.1 3-oxoadipate enol-lactonase [Micromonospora profundi]